MGRTMNYYFTGILILGFVFLAFCMKPEACGNCGLYSNKRSFCGRWGSKGVKDTYVCHEWRKRFFKR